VERLILLARAPSLDRVKTRLTPPLSKEQALALHVAMLEDQIRFVAGLRAPSREAELCLDTEWSPASSLPAIRRTSQGDGDLGARMARALTRAFEEGAGAAVIVGGDAPTLPAALVEEAFAALASGARAVVTPALDGGYVLIGATPPPPPLFAGVPWGTAEVLDATRRLARGASIVLHETRAWGDVDTIADLRRLSVEIRADPERAPSTQAALTTLRLYSGEDPVV